MMAAQNIPEIHESFMKLPFRSKPRSTDPLVLSSLTSSVPFAIPGAVEVLEKSKSAPSSPVREEKKRKGFLRHFPRPKSPSSPRKQSLSLSDPERSPSPNDLPGSKTSSRPNWLHLRNHRKKKSKDMNGSMTPIDDSSGSIDDLSRTLEPVATPVDDLPGRTIIKSASGSTIPVITVSHTGEDSNHISGCVSLDDITVESVDIRKMSQSSHCSSNLHSAATSGVGSLLSPSGDESYICDDLESPISPLSSRTSSFTEQVPSDLSDLDQMDLVSPLSDQGSITTPVSASGFSSPPHMFNAESPTDPHAGLRSPTEGTPNQKPKKKKERSARWDNLKKAVRAWSPFAVQFKKKCYPWVQLAGHQGNFMPGDESGTIMKKSDSNERKALQGLMNDDLKPFVPEFKKVVEKEGHLYVEMTDLLREFDEPAVMDIKMGVRTYLEEELKKKNLRPDMYNKMVDVDPNEPTEAEHAQKAITKPRYMQWRESLSSSSTLGFRVEGIKTTAGKAIKDFKETRDEQDVLKALRLFIEENPSVKEPFLRRLLNVKAALERSAFFNSHELIGSSLLFVYDNTNMCSIHMIDFGKTVSLPNGVTIDHSSRWVEGNHEDGYLYGLENLLRLWEQL